MPRPGPVPITSPTVLPGHLSNVGRITARRYRRVVDRIYRPGRRHHHPYLRAWALLATLTLVAGACSNGGSNAANERPTPSTLAATAPVLDPVETPCLSASPTFPNRGTISILGRTAPDATQLSGIDWLVTPDCERIVFGFLTEESAPASSIGLSRVEFFPELGIVRIMMPRDVRITAIADSLVGGSLIDRAFVVRARSGDLAVDLHMSPGARVEARGLLIGSPARLVVDVRPGPGDTAAATDAVTIGRDVVVLSPAPGAAAYPLRIRGYARTNTDVVTATVSGSGDPIERRITAAPSGDAWGEFAVTISEGPAGEISLRVATDQTVPGANGQGVSILLTTG